MIIGKLGSPAILYQLCPGDKIVLVYFNCCIPT